MENGPTEETEAREVTVVETDLMPTMVSDIAATKARLAQLQAFVKDVMHEGDDYGVIPGTQKPSLLKPGAEKLLEVYGIAPRPEVVNRIEDWGQTCANCGTSRPAFFAYEIRCDGISKRTGQVIGSGLGSCNSRETKYRWRDSLRHCPQCGQETIIKGKEEYGGGFLCFKKKGGCGAKFAEDDATITDQPAGRVENDQVEDLNNTILKMAKKRALVDLALSVTRSSDLFTQDAEDTTGTNGEHPKRSSTAKPERKVTGKVGCITPGQVALLMRRCEEKKVSEDRLLAYLADTFGVEHRDDLPFDKVDEVLAWVKAGGK